MSSIRKEEIVSSTWIRLVEYHEVLDSTNRLAVELRDHLLPESPALVITDLQTAGRGRGSNNWWSAEGALSLTVVLNADVHGPVPEHRPLVALARWNIASALPNRSGCEATSAPSSPSNHSAPSGPALLSVTT